MDFFLRGRKLLVNLVAPTLLLLPAMLHAHCDTMDGPVIQAARLALESKDVRPVLKWVSAENEVEIRAAFDRTLAVRQGSDAARELADNYFFETLVRIHRAGEGEPYSGLKPAGQVEPGIAAADQAVEAANANALTEELVHSIGEQVATRFHRVIEAREHSNESTEAGRDFVRAYVEYIHFVERLYELLNPLPEHAHGTH